MSENWVDQRVKNLFKAILKLKTSKECGIFFRDLCTLSELKAIAERWEIAQCVSKKISYREISRRTGASTATVTRVAHWVHHGEGGYRLVLDRS